MPTARKDIVNLDLCQYYHCISRCVRRAFLCGQDNQTGRSFNHRKQWLVDLMHEMAEVFAIQICAYAVMSNHYHLVLFVNVEEALSWTDKEVVQRWASLFPMSKAQTYIEMDINFHNLKPNQISNIKQWRSQLMDISWFMRKLNEYIARKANKEDECAGRFWEGRFKSQALLDESALLACMAYVDLNPIRAGISQTPESSNFTSIQRRIQDYNNKQSTPNSMCRFENGNTENKFTKTKDHNLPCTQLDYFELVDTTGRLVRSNKKGAIPNHIEPILARLNIKHDNWTDTITTLSQSFSQFMGRPESIEKCMTTLKRPRLQGLKQAAISFKKRA
ncbi:MAG TPA: transposase [Gammaproteobacteria bacterium]|nr:transposase [Gammaproteobacteria bacterium]